MSDPALAGLILTLGAVEDPTRPKEKKANE